MSGGSQACASCKYQRRKCGPKCPLAPFFPPDAHRQFLNAHRLFGVSNIQKIIRDLDPEKKEIAMRTIIFQSNVRASDPVGGCVRLISELQHKISLAAAELDLVLQQLALCREQSAAQNQMMMMLAMSNGDHAIPIAAGPTGVQRERALANGHGRDEFGVRHVAGERNHCDIRSVQGKESKRPCFVEDCEDIKPILATFEDKQLADDEPIHCRQLNLKTKDILLCSKEAELNEGFDYEQPHDSEGVVSIVPVRSLDD